MAKGLIEASVLTNIANAIRAKDGSTAKMLPSAMAGKISNISTSPTVKTGTFTPTYPALASKGVTVSNLGGQPKHVAVYLNLNGDTEEQHGLIFWQKGLADGYLAGRSQYDDSEEWPYLKCTNAVDSYSSLTLTSTGFTLSSTNSNFGTKVFLAQYKYIAIM